MFRFLLWIGLGYFFYRLFFKSRRSLDNGVGDRGAPGMRGTQASGSGEKMVKCAVCGLYVPEKEALAGGWRDSGRYYCSSECQQRGA
ncbi:MAG: PP0621 family protein [Pseudomonadota bacterium]|nr:PP0621 family protein [Pseudomonadota bacterium]